MATLEIRSGPNSGSTVEITAKETMIGRDSFCDLVITDHTISRQHTRIVHTPKGFYVEDMSSLNGTFINGQRIQKRTQISDQDRIHLHETLIVFHENFRGSVEPPAEAPVEDAPAPAARTETVDGLPATIVDALEATTGPSVDVNAGEKLRAVLEITRSLGSTLNVDDVLPKILDVLFTLFAQADRGHIMVADQPDGSLTLREVKLRKSDASDEGTLGPISSSMAEQVMSRGQGILSTDAFNDDDFDMSESVLDFPIRSMMCAPLMGPSRTCLGVIHLDTDDPERRFFQDDLEVLLSVATVAGQAIEHARQHEASVELDRRERELATAREVQLHFLPQQQPEIPGYSFFADYRSAEEVGGDYYGHIKLSDRRVAISIGDVSGKGVSAALMMARLSADVRYFLATIKDCAEAVTLLNRELITLSGDTHFITFCLCVLDLSSHELTIVNAGHMAPLCRRQATGKTEKLGLATVGMPLGVRADRVYQAYTSPLAAGDTIVLYTDGISEAMNPLGKPYGSKRLGKIVAEESSGAVELGRKVLTNLAEYTEDSPQSDDICLICFARDGQ